MALLKSLQDYLDERLKEEGVGTVRRERFAELTGRLLATGVLWRNYSGPEAAAYDDALQVEQLLREYFGAMNFVLTHDVDASLFRLYPPGEGGADEDEDGVKKLKTRLSRDFVAACLGLRFLYTEALTGKRELIDEVLTISLEELSQVVVSLLAHTLPASSADRASLLRDLRKHRVVRFKDSDTAGSMETVLNVLRPVMSYVSDEALQDALKLTEIATASKQARAPGTKSEVTAVAEVLPEPTALAATPAIDDNPQGRLL